MSNETIELQCAVVRGLGGVLLSLAGEVKECEKEGINGRGCRAGVGDRFLVL